MPNFKETKILPYLPRHIFDLVLDINSYPEFLPWCRCANIIEKTVNHNSGQIIAELGIEFKLFSENYVSSVTYNVDSDKYCILVNAISGPFEYLKNQWHISQYDYLNSKVEFDIDFKFKSIICNKLVSIIFLQATKTIMTAFEDRAKSLLIKH